MSFQLSIGLYSSLSLTSRAVCVVVCYVVVRVSVG